MQAKNGFGNGFSRPQATISIGLPKKSGGTTFTNPFYRKLSKRLGSEQAFLGPPPAIHFGTRSPLIFWKMDMTFELCRSC